MENTEALIEISETILGPNRSALQANVFDLRGQMIGAGYYSRIERDVKGEPWYATVMKAGGDQRDAFRRDMDPLLEQTYVVKDKRYVSWSGVSRTRSCLRRGLNRGGAVLRHAVQRAGSSERHFRFVLPL